MRQIQLVVEIGRVRQDIGVIIEERRDLRITT